MINRRASPALLLVAVLLSACSKPNERLVDLVAEFGDPSSIHGQANYELKRRNDILKREFEVELENGKAGSVYVVTTDGVRLGKVTIDAEGEGKLAVSDAGNDSRFPDDFVEPKVGSVVKVGDIFEGPMREKPARSTKHSRQREKPR